MSVPHEERFVLLDPVDGELEELAQRLDRDFLAAAAISGNALRVVVHNYHELQRLRISLHNAARAIERAGHPSDFVRSLGNELKRIERSITAVMREWIREYPVSEWALEQIGVGPVAVATLLAYLDVDKCRTPSSVWSYCGLAPDQVHAKGEKAAYSRRLKRLCYILGDTFRKLSRHPECYYGHVYRQRKQYEVERNEAGLYAEQARAKLEDARRRRTRITTAQREAWSAGKLTAAHIDLRARRYAVKLFLSHFAWVYWETEKGTPWPMPYAVAHLAHVDIIPPPGYTPLQGAAVA